MQYLYVHTFDSNNKCSNIFNYVYIPSILSLYKKPTVSPIYNYSFQSRFHHRPSNINIQHGKARWKYSSQDGDRNPYIESPSFRKISRIIGFPSSLPAICQPSSFLFAWTGQRQIHSDEPVSLISVNPETRVYVYTYIYIYASVHTQASCVYIEQEEGEYRSSERRLCFSIRRRQPWILRVRIRRGDVHGHFSHCLLSICRFKYICSRLNRPVSR